MAHLDPDAPPVHETSSSGERVSFEVTLHEDAGKSLLVTITPPREPTSKEKQPGRRAPLDLCLVINVSRSMSALIEEGKSKESKGLSVLDVVKHACCTILSTMQDDDRLSVVTFTKEIVSEFRETTETGKEALLESIEKLPIQNRGDLWDGLHTGMNLFNDLPTSTSSRLSALFILTDGWSSVQPPRGYIPMLENYLESHPIVRSALTISSFGFGLKLDSMLLSEIGRVGGGGYSFIPDAEHVGIVFVHVMANLYATYAIRCALNVEVPKGVKVKKVRGRFIKVDASWGSKVDFGDLQYGQTRDIILEFEGGRRGKLPEVTVSVVARPWFATEALTVSVTHTLVAVPVSTTDAHKYHLYRLDLVDSIFSLCSEKKIQTVDSIFSLFSKKTRPAAALKTATKYFNAQSKMINTSLPDHPDAVALASEIDSVVVSVLSDEHYWTRWGRHYFLVLASAHRRQQCSNVKDPGLLVYGQQSPLFIKSRDELDAAFDKLPPPKPPTVRVDTNTRASATTAPRGTASGNHTSRDHSMATGDHISNDYSRADSCGGMASYGGSYGGDYGSYSGPCFAGECQVLLEDGRKVALQELRRSVKVVTPKGTRRVGAVVRTVIGGGRLMMCRIGELKVTPWHPIRIERKWVFPADVVEAQLEECDAVYSALLEADVDVDAHAFEVEGVTAVTLGHGLVASNGADVRAHPFFGSYTKVLGGLRDLAGFKSEDGVAHCVGVHRDSVGLICGFAKPAVNTTSPEAFSHTVVVTACLLFCVVSCFV